MKQPLYIQSPGNPRIKELIRLQNHRRRRQAGLMLVEGLSELALAWASGLEAHTVFICPQLLKSPQNPDYAAEQHLLGLVEQGQAEVVHLSPEAMKKASYRDHPDAWLCLARAPSLELQGLALPRSQPALLIIAEDLEKPGNLGAILRSIDAAGGHGLISAQGRTDLLNPNVVRSSKGCLFQIPSAEASNRETLSFCRTHGIRVFAAVPEARTGYWDTDLSGPSAIVVGAEKEGLSDFWKQEADELITIPMLGRVNSLNVAQAATLMLYEAMRQRRDPGRP